MFPFKSIVFQASSLSVKGYQAVLFAHSKIVWPDNNFIYFVLPLSLLIYRAEIKSKNLRKKSRALPRNYQTSVTAKGALQKMGLSNYDLQEEKMLAVTFQHQLQLATRKVQNKMQLIMLKF